MGMHCYVALSSFRAYKLPWHIYVQQTLARHAESTETANFVACMGCTSTKMAYIALRGKQNTVVPGSVEGMVDDDMRMYCATAKTAAPSVLRESIRAQVCHGEPLRATSLVGQVVICDSTAYTLCTRCGLIAQIPAVHDGTFLCRCCARVPDTPTTKATCVACDNPVRLTDMATEHRLFYQRTHLALAWRPTCCNCRNNLIWMSKRCTDLPWPPTVEDLKTYNTNRYLANERKHING